MFHFYSVVIHLQWLFMCSHCVTVRKTRIGLYCVETMCSQFIIIMHHPYIIKDFIINLSYSSDGDLGISDIVFALRVLNDLKSFELIAAY